MTRDMDTCNLTSDNPANFPVCAGICLSHLNSNHANIAVVPNGFYCNVIAEYTNSYAVNESFFSSTQQKDVPFYKSQENDFSLFIYFLFGLEPCQNW